MEQEKLIALVKNAQAGDSGAMEQLLTYAHTPVSYQCRKFMSSPEDAEDMTQEVLLAVYQKLDTLADPAAFNGWVKRITATRCMNAVSRTHVDLQFAEDEEGNSFLDTIEELDQQKVPEAALDNAETARMVVELIDGLPEAQRICTYLYYYDELSVKEIAELTAASENTVKSRLNYARKAIKEGVLDHEKKGVKLYGLSPLPFLLYFLRMAAQAEASEAAAAACAAGVMAANTAAAGAAAGTSVSAASAAGKAAGFLSRKLIAGIVAGVVALGGGTVAAIHLVNRFADTVPVFICQHEWADATCKAPRTCLTCNSTEGEALGHTWIDATCEIPKTCSVCSGTEGDPLGHDMAEANYQQPATCRACGYTEGEPLPAAFETSGLTILDLELGVSYDYEVTCYQNRNRTTTGTLTFSNYQVFQSSEEYEAIEGYEYRSIDVHILFNDANAWNYGIMVRNLLCDYCKPSNMSDSPGGSLFTVNYMGVDYDQCMQLGFDVFHTDGWNRQEKSITYTQTIIWRLPVGYSGRILAYVDGLLDVPTGEPMIDLLQRYENPLIFRIPGTAE